MRDIGVDNVVFTNKDNKSFEIKDIRIVPDYTIISKIKVTGEVFLDEVATRSDVYGVGTEDLNYKIFDANMREIVENRFDFTKIKELKIPNG